MTFVISCSDFFLFYSIHALKKEKSPVVPKVNLSKFPEGHRCSLNKGSLILSSQKEKQTSFL